LERLRRRPKTEGQNNGFVQVISEYFPSNCFKGINSHVKNLGRDDERLLLYYLGHIEVYLNLRHLTIPEETLKEISKRLGLQIDKYLVLTYRGKILQLDPELRKLYSKNLGVNNGTVFMSTCRRIIAIEMQLNGLKSDDIFRIEHRCFELARELINKGKLNSIVDYDLWGRAICLRALKDIVPDYSHNIFPSLDADTLTMLESIRSNLDTFITM